MRRGILFACVGASLLLAGCQNAPRHTLGKPEPGASSVQVGSLLGDGKLPDRPVALQGTLVEKCPSSGCWLRLKDASGTIKVDLRASGATVTDVPLGTQVSVTGRAVRVGDEANVEASGVMY